MNKNFTIFLFSFALISCSNPLEREYNAINLDRDIIAIEKIENMNQEDKNILKEWLRNSNLKHDLTGKTYHQILEDAKKFAEMDEQFLQDKINNDDENEEDKVNKVLNISINDYNHKPANINDYQFNSYHIFKYTIHNNSDKEIKAIKFGFHIYNALGDEIGDGYMKSFTDKRIKPYGTYKGTMSFNAENDINDLKLVNSNFDDLIFNFTVNKIVYTDGTELM